MMLNCLIVDLEPSVLDLLEKYVGRTPFLQLTDRLQSASDALQCVKEVSRESCEGVDIIFWGLVSSPLNDIELSYILSEWGRGCMKVILTRGLDESVPPEFKNNIMTQLPSPISYKQFLETAMNAYDWFVESAKITSVSESQTGEDTFQHKDSIWIKDGYRQANLLFSDILCIERANDHVLIRLVDGKQMVTQMTLKTLTEQLPKDEFVRVHRSYIVHLPKVNVIEHGYIVFDQMQIPISNSYRNNFMQMLAQRVFVAPEEEVVISNVATPVDDISIAAQDSSLPD